MTGQMRIPTPLPGWLLTWLTQRGSIRTLYCVVSIQAGLCRGWTIWWWNFSSEQDKKARAGETYQKLHFISTPSTHNCTVGGCCCASRRWEASTKCKLVEAAKSFQMSAQHMHTAGIARRAAISSFLQPTQHYPCTMFSCCRHLEPVL